MARIGQRSILQRRQYLRQLVYSPLSIDAKFYHGVRHNNSPLLLEHKVHNLVQQSESSIFSIHPKLVKRRLCTESPDPTRLLRELCGRIKLMGPLTMADYMREVLVNPRLGYYMSGQVLGAQGDFVTSPEISQMFGECLGIWVLNEWQKMGAPPLQLVELGPGKGTLMSDILRTISKLSPDSLSKISVHLVELSPAMRREQELALGDEEDLAKGVGHSEDLGQENSQSKDLGLENGNLSKESSLENSQRNPVKRSKYGPSLHWYESLLDVPQGFSFFLAHEFFDALPIHKLTRTPDGWREILIDINPDCETPSLRYVISRHSTPACRYVSPSEMRHHVEVCPTVGVLAREMASRIVRAGGAALVADYGHVGQMEDTLRAFSKHKQVDPLQLPGMADITADVDFKYMEDHISEGAKWFGPVEQGAFLHSLGIKFRCQQLVRASDDEKLKQEVISGYDTLTNPDKMGSRFKFAAMFPKTMKVIHDKYPPVGFEN